MKTSTTSPRITPSGLFSRLAILPLSLFALCFAGVSAAQAQVIDVSRYASWNATGVSFQAGAHGTASNPTAAVWNYYRQAGRLADGTANTTLEPATWTAMGNYNIGEDLFNFNTAGGRVKVRMTEEHLYTYWTPLASDPTDPPIESRASWAITAYQELNEQGGVYDIGGKLSWELATTATSGTIYIVIAKISTTGDVSVLFDQTVSRTSLGISTVFDQAEDTLPSSLTGITLAEGEQLAFGIRGSGNQHRSTRLIDQELTLTQTQIPEPAQAGLILSGLSALAVLMLRRNASGHR